MKSIAIVLLNFNGEKDTIECLKSIKKLETDGFALLTIVVDNGSEKKFRVQSSEFRVGELKIIHNDKNLGFSGGNNVGIRYAFKKNADYILILNNDTVVDKSLVLELLKLAQSDESIGIVVPKIYFAKGFEFHKDRYNESEQGRVIWYAGGIMDWKNVIGVHRGVDEVDRGQYEKVIETDFASGCCMFVKREVFERVGMFDEKYFLYYEDNDLSQRAKREGFKIIYSPKAVLWHKNAGSAGGSGSSLQDYYITRNRLLFGMRYVPIRSKLSLIKESFELLFFGRTWQKRGVLDFYLKRFGKGSFQG
ncbi:MAG: glycosyltransferase family 2 protein [Candidatus Levybacteria bacterium]|nr:glycosyltransferase family 2 protein [Candidatus Levybacteria bacterium]